MGTILDKQEVLSDDNEETNNVQLEIYQKMNLIKRQDLDAIPLKEVRRKLEKKYGKLAAESEINEIGEELKTHIHIFVMRQAITST